MLVMRRVFTGWALQKGAKFRCCWLVEFVHEKVVDSYRDHPDHVAEARARMHLPDAETAELVSAHLEGRGAAGDNGEGVRGVAAFLDLARNPDIVSWIRCWASARLARASSSASRSI